MDLSCYSRRAWGITRDRVSLAKNWQPAGPLEIGTAPSGNFGHQEKDSQAQEKRWACHLPQFEQHFTTETRLTGSHNISRGMSLGKSARSDHLLRPPRRRQSSTMFRSGFLARRKNPSPLKSRAEIIAITQSNPRFGSRPRPLQQYRPPDPSW